MLALSGCGGGGESAKINEDPFRGVITSSNGCNPENTNCQAFVIDYPVEGLNFDCSSLDKHFVTKLESNVASGACLNNDKINFYIQGGDRKISLGTVDLAQLNPVKTNDKTVFIGLLDIAKGMTGRNATTTEVTDDTFKTMVGITRIFQAIGIKQNGYLVGDVQPITLSTNFKNGLSALAQNVDVSDFLDGSYVSDIQPWLDVNSTNQLVTQDVAKRLTNLSNVGIYTAEYLPFSTVNSDVSGFYGKSQINDSIANMYMLTTRQGYTIGYAIQWIGTPIGTGNQLETVLGRINLLSQVVPNKLNTYSATGQSGNLLSDVKNWINPLNQKISTPLTLRSSETSSDLLEIYQGTLIAQNAIPGNEFVYEGVTGSKGGSTDSSVYGKWRQSKQSEQFNGTIDIYKKNPATYLNREVFLTAQNTKAGEAYIFPFYADLIFNFEDSSIPSVKLGIVIDENGDIRTNRTNTDLSSNQCLTVDSNLLDSDGVQQYRIGTTGAVNSSSNDRSITLRIILANPIFGNIDGALVGLNYSDQSLPNTVTGQTSFSSDGVRINLQRLLTDKNTQQGVNITGWVGERAKNAEWANMYAAYQKLYNSNSNNAGKITSEQADLAKRLNGTLDIQLPSCYSVKIK